MMMRATILTVLCLGVAYARMGAAQVPQPPTFATGQTAGPSATCPELATALVTLMGNDIRLRDWANLARYHGDNGSVKPPAAGESRVVFMGDSNTDE
jgi:hypothetical protein